MGITNPDGTWAPSPVAGSFDPIDWHISPMLLGAAADSAISGRSDGVRGPRFLAATASDVAATKASAGLAVGDRLFRSDTGTTEVLRAEGWKVVHTLRGIAFTPNWAGLNSVYTINPGNGQQSWSYHVDGDRVSATGVLVFGSTTSIGTSPIGMMMPLVPGFTPRFLAGDGGVIGDLAAGIGVSTYRGLLTAPNDSIQARETAAAQIVFRGTMAGGGTQKMSNTAPATWGQGSWIAASYSYQTI